MFEPTFTSVKTHPLPDWFSDAKLGIFIHWGLYSVPAFAPRISGDINDLLLSGADMGASPYAEWYQNSLRIQGSPTCQYHNQKYGPNFRYEQFAPIFNEQIQTWQPEAWADLFARAGARYVVLTAKHHDGFLLWQSRHPNPRMGGYQARRDLLGELTEAIQNRGLRMGVYYSSLLDWTFTSRPIRRLGDLMTVIPKSPVYRAYVENHWLELIDRYKPWVLWGDIGYPPGGDVAKVFAHFYNRQPEGVVNDRWMQLPGFLANPVGSLLLERIMKRVIRQSLQGGQPPQPRVPHCDFVTTEYSQLQTYAKVKWEACRGIGKSFGFNQFEGEDDYLKTADLIRLFVEIVSANGNLLLNVGPRADGTIHEYQIAALEGLGDWLAVNGEAIYASKPWLRCKEAGLRGGEACYTCKGQNLFILIVRHPASGELLVNDLPILANSPAIHLASGKAIPWNRQAEHIAFLLPRTLEQERTPVLRVQLAG